MRPYHTILCGSVVEWWASLLVVLVLEESVAPVDLSAVTTQYLSREATASAPSCLRWCLRPAMLVETFALRWRRR